MQASTTAIRTSSILSGLMAMDSAMAVAVRLASISMSGTMGSVRVTSRRMGLPAMTVARSRLDPRRTILEGEVELQGVDDHRVDEVVGQEHPEAGDGGQG